MTRIELHRMTSRSAVVWSIGTAVALLGVAVYYFVTGPVEDRPYTAFPVLLVGFCAYAVLRARVRIAVADGSVVVEQRRSFRTRRVDLVTASEVFLRGNGGGQTQLVVKGDGRPAVVPLLMDTLYVRGYQRAEVLEPLIDGVQRNRRLPVTDRTALADVLAAQLRHARAGGPVETAPLHAYAGDMTRAIGAVGAAGAAASLTD